MLSGKDQRKDPHAAEKHSNASSATQALASLPHVEGKASELGHELAGLTLSHPDKTQHALTDVGTSLQTASKLVSKERGRTELGAAARHGYEGAKDVVSIGTAAPQRVWGALSKGVQSAADTFNGVRHFSLQKGGKGVYEGGQSGYNTLAAVAHSPRSAAGAVWESMCAAGDIVLIPVLAPRQSFKTAWQAITATRDVAGLTVSAPRKTYSMFGALAHAVQQVQASVASTTAAARTVPGGKFIPSYLIQALVLPLVIVAALFGLLIGSFVEFTGRALNVITIFFASCINQAARVLAARFAAHPPKIVRYAKPRVSQLELHLHPEAADDVQGREAGKDNNSPAVITPGTAVAAPAYLNSPATAEAEKGEGSTDANGQQQEGEKKGEGSEAVSAGGGKVATTAGLVGSTPAVTPMQKDADKTAAQTPGADVGVRPTLHAAYEALQDARERETREESSRMSRLANSLMFWKRNGSKGSSRRNSSKDQRAASPASYPLPFRALHGQDGSLASTSAATEGSSVAPPSQAVRRSRSSYREKPFWLSLGSKKQTNLTPAQLRASFKREEPCSGTVHGAVPTTEGPLLPALAVGLESTPYQLSSAKKEDVAPHGREMITDASAPFPVAGETTSSTVITGAGGTSLELITKLDPATGEVLPYVRKCASVTEEKAGRQAFSEPLREGAGVPRRPMNEHATAEDTKSQPLTEVFRDVVRLAWREAVETAVLLLLPLIPIFTGTIEWSFWSVSALIAVSLAAVDSLRCVWCASKPAVPGEPITHRLHRVCSLLLQPSVAGLCAMGGAMDTAFWRGLGAWASLWG